MIIRIQTQHEIGYNISLPGPNTHSHWISISWYSTSPVWIFDSDFPGTPIYYRQIAFVFMYRPFRPVRQPEDSNLATDEKFKQKWNSSSKLCSPFQKFLMGRVRSQQAPAGGVISAVIMQGGFQTRLLSTGSRLLPHFTVECTGHLSQYGN